MRASLNVRRSKAVGSTNMSRDGMIADLRALCAREGFVEIVLRVDDGYAGSLRWRGRPLGSSFARTSVRRASHGRPCRVT
ncbi:hypothetical protein KRMM14A1259_11200 [Krasilnikovia sp. MM14-A1259]